MKYERGRELNIAVFGQTRWGSIMAQTINAMPEEGGHAIFIEAKDALKPVSLRAIREADVLMRVGFRPGARTRRGIAFDVVWTFCRCLNRRARAAHFWVGTDVMNTVRDDASDRLFRPMFRRVLSDVHFATAPWLIEELEQLGIHAQYVLFFDRLPDDVIAIEPSEMLPHPFTVLTYIPDARPDFYGARYIYECARALPQVLFEVIGGNGSWVENPLPNFHVLGWQSIAECLKRASVLVRMVEHDGIGGTVRQALAAARHVIYTYPLPFVSVVRFGDTSTLITKIQDLYSIAQKRGLPPNLAGREYALAQFEIKEHYKYMLQILRSAESCQLQ